MGYVCPRGLELLRTGVISQVVRAIACFSSVTSKPSLAKSASDVLVWLAAWKSRDEERAFSPLAPLRRNSCRRVHLRSFHNPGYVQQCNMNTTIRTSRRKLFPPTVLHGSFRCAPQSGQDTLLGAIKPFFFLFVTSRVYALLSHLARHHRLSRSPKRSLFKVCRPAKAVARYVRSSGVPPWSMFN